MIERGGVATESTRTRTVPSQSFNRSTRLIGSILLVFLFPILSLLSACDPSTSGEIEYQPVLLPIKLTYNGSSIDIKGEKEIVTFIGTFSIGAKYALPDSDPDAIYVIIRNHKEPPAGFDHIYKVRTGSGDFSAVVNGRTVIQVVDRQVLIDVTDSQVEDIQLKNVEPVPTANGSNLIEKWDEYWTWAPYKPFSLFTWAYDDSTMSKWYGLGFVYFLIRLALALVLLVFDLILTAVFLVACVAYLLLGADARNVVFGIFALPLFIIVLIMLGSSVMKRIR